ncbi:MAG: nicotinate-nucleotide--dimethylbenzimidazole phosphoribosyltransferase [Candidatus Tectomicrobia bacterium]|nr:nicotinate-nucleotide--dimethylbenzimidazole phosphoribosyltransferase [Candidatus Tectomicrobia bacterium]
MKANRYAFDAAARDVLYRVISARRDVRNYRPEPIPDEVIWRILEAAHQAPSVGFMQPWNFLLIRDPALRKQVHDNYVEVNRRAAAAYEADANLRYRSLKLQGILDSPLNLLVTCDRARGGPAVLGRTTMPETDLYSTCLAIENLWLAARAEGLGVGWMSIAEPECLQQIFDLPESVVPVAYLTLGWPVEMPDEPLLARVGWRQRTSLADLVFENSWGVAASKSTASEASPAAVSGGVVTIGSGRARRAQLTRPPGSLGRLEGCSAWLADLQGSEHPRVERRWLLLFAGDHGVTEEGVSAYRQEVTAKMVYQFVAGGAAVSAIARQHGIQVRVADLGVDHDFLGAKGVADKKVRRGTRNLAREAAMTREECQRAIHAGAELVSELGDVDLLAVGEMGIGNSTSAAALAAALLGISASEAVGIGTGVGPRTMQHKVKVVEVALSLHHDALGDPTTALACLGGYEIAGMVGAIEQATRQGLAVLLDGFITGVAALVAMRREPRVSSVLMAGHRSAEPAHNAILKALELEPILELDMRLGEGSGAALAMALVTTACRIDNEMVTFEEAGIENAEREGGRH